MTVPEILLSAVLYSPLFIRECQSLSALEPTFVPSLKQIITVMKSLKFLLPVALGAMLFCSCEEKGGDSSKYITIEDNIVTKDASAQEFTVAVTTDANLLNVTVEYEEGGQTGWVSDAWFSKGLLNVEIRENIVMEDRTAFIKLSAKGLEPATLTLVQQAALEAGDPWKEDYLYEWNDSWTLKNYVYSGVKYDPINFGENGLPKVDGWWYVYGTSGNLTFGHLLKDETLNAFAGKTLTKIEYSANAYMDKVTLGIATVKESTNPDLDGWKRKNTVYTIDKVLGEQEYIISSAGWLMYEPEVEIPSGQPVMVYAKIEGDGVLYGPDDNGYYNAMLWVKPQPVNELVPLYFNDENALGQDMFLMTAGGGIEFNFTVDSSIFE